MNIESRYGYIIEDLKIGFITALFEKNEEDALYWAYELYYSNLQYDILSLINDIYDLLYYDKYNDQYGIFLNSLCNEWEDTNRNKHTVLGSIIKNLIKLDISITDIVRIRQKNLNNPLVIRILNDNNDKQNTRENTHFEIMSDDELLELNKKYQENESNKKNMRRERNTPIYVCNLLGIKLKKDVLSRLEFMSYIDWCNLYSTFYIKQTVYLRRVSRRYNNCS